MNHRRGYMGQGPQARDGNSHGDTGNGRALPNPNSPAGLARAQRLASVWDGSDQTSVNLFRKQFDIASTQDQRMQMEQLARAAGRELGPETVLRPHILSFAIAGITETENRQFSARFNPQFDLYITKMTATLMVPVLGDAFQPSAIFQNTIRAEDYLLADITLGSTEKITEGPTPLSHLSWRGDLPYLWDIMPFLPKRVTLDWDFQVAQPLESAFRFDLKLHTLRFDLV